MADIGTGCTITFASGFMAEITAINGTGMTREEFQTSHMGTTDAHTFIGGDLYDPGGIDVDLLFDPDDEPPIDSAAETVTITLPVPSGKTNGATIVGSGFMTAFSWSAPLEDLMTASATLKLSGDLTWADAS